MEKPVFFGDSLVGGRYGVWFGRFLSHEASYHGIDGQFIDDIIVRAVKFCLNHKNQTIVIEGGVNDIVLAKCRKSIFNQWKEGLEELASLCSTLYVCTIAPAGEDPHSSENRTRAALNEAIRQNADQIGYIVIDVAAALDPLLSGTGLKVNPLDLLIDDRQRLSKYEGRELEAESMDISSSRGFALTTDGVHLNWRGAGLFAAAVDEVLG